MLTISLVAIGEELKRWRKSNRFTQSEVAERVGVSRGAYANWESDLAQPTGANMDRLRALGFPGSAEPEPTMLGLRPMPMAKVPIVGSVSAGDGSYVHPEFGEDIEIPAHMALHPTAASVATGDSMMPWIEPGDIVIARLHQEPRPNQPMLVRRPDGSVSVKIMKFREGEWQLTSMNPKYEAEPAKVEILGYVTGIYRARGSHLYMEFDPGGLRP